MTTTDGPDAAQLEEEYSALEESRTSWNRLSWSLGIPGVIMITISNIMFFIPMAHANSMATPTVNPLAAILGLLGQAGLIAGLVYYAKYKGRNPAWGLMGFLGIIGLITLLCIRDFNKARMLEIARLLDASQQPFRQEHPMSTSYPVAAFHPMSPSHTSGLAIASLVVALAGLFTCGLGAAVGLILGICAMGGIKKSQGALTGRGLAISGISISVFLLAITIIVVAAGLLGAASAQREQANWVESLALMKQIQLAATLYQDDHNGILPDADK